MSKLVEATSLKSQATYELKIPNTDKAVGIELSLIPAKNIPESMAVNTNIAKIEIDGNDFLIVAGKTVAL